MLILIYFYYCSSSSFSSNGSSIVGQLILNLNHKRGNKLELNIGGI